MRCSLTRSMATTGSTAVLPKVQCLSHLRSRVSEVLAAVRIGNGSTARELAKHLPDWVLFEWDHGQEVSDLREVCETQRPILRCLRPTHPQRFAR